MNSRDFKIYILDLIVFKYHNKKLSFIVEIKRNLILMYNA